MREEHNMNHQQRSNLFKAIDKNVRTGNAALNQTLLDAKKLVSASTSNDAGKRNASEDAIATASRVAHLLLAAQYEARLAWLTWHPNSRLTIQQRHDASSGGISKRWTTLLKIALSDRLARREPSIEIRPQNLPRGLPKQDRARYYDLIRVARDHLSPLIDTRNSLAHGEWTIALNRDGKQVNPERTEELDRISLFRVTILANLLEHYWKCYFDALVTYQAFERDFPVHHRRMMYAARRLESASEDKWLENLRRRFTSGRSSTGGLSDPP